MAEQLERAGRGHHRGRLPDLVGRRLRGGARGRRAQCGGRSIAGLARAVPGDIDRAWAALLGRARGRASTSSSRPRTCTSSTSCASTRDAVPRRGRGGRRATPARYSDDVEFSAEDATRSDLAFLCEVAAAAVEAGATTINLPDTVGYATAGRTSRAMFTRASRGPGRRTTSCLSAHCHNDLGHGGGQLARRRRRPARARWSARSTASASAPATPSLEEIVMALRRPRATRCRIDTGVVTTQLCPDQPGC